MLHINFVYQDTCLIKTVIESGRFSADTWLSWLDKLHCIYRIWPNKGPGAYCFQRVQPPGPYLNPAVIWAPALNDFVASNTQKLPFFFINRQAIRHHANTKVYHIFFLLICDFHVIKFIHSSTHNHSKLNLFIHHNYIITRLSHNLHV